MANGLMNLSNLLGQSSNASGLLGGGIFSQPESRGSRRSRLLTEAISGAGADPYSRLGATFGGLIGMGARAGAEGLGIVDEPPEVQRNNAIRQVQQEVAELGLDPLQNPAEFGEVVSNRFRELNQPELALRTQLQMRQMAPEPVETERVVIGGTEEGSVFNVPPGQQAIATYVNGQPRGISDLSEVDGGQELTNIRDIETEDRGTVTVGTQGGRLVEVTAEGTVPFEGDRDIDEEAKFTARNISLPEIGTVIGQVDKETGRVFYRGQDVTNQAQFAPQRVEQGEPGSFDLTQKQEFGIREARVAAQNYANTAEDAIALLEESPDVNTFVGRGASIINSLQAEGKALARAAGVEFDEDILEPSNYGDQFRDLGINNRRLQGIITSGAFQAAAASGQVGRSVSNRDMERFIGEFGANASDPQAFAATLRDSVNRTVRNLRNRSEELYGEDLGEDITFMGEPIGFTQQELRDREAGISREEAAKQLPSNATLGRKNPETNAWEVYRDGKLIGEIRPD